MLKNQKSDRFCRQTPSSENDFLVKFSQNSIKLASCGIHRQNLCSPLCCCAKCQFCNIIRCGKIFVFFDQEASKDGFVKRPVSPKRSDFWNLLLWKILPISTSKSAFERIWRIFYTLSNCWWTLYWKKEGEIYCVFWIEWFW